MTLRTTKTTTGTIGFDEEKGEMRIENDQELIALVILNKGQGHQLINQINRWLWYHQ